MLDESIEGLGGEDGSQRRPDGFCFQKPRQYLRIENLCAFVSRRDNIKQTSRFQRHCTWKCIIISFFIYQVCPIVPCPFTFYFSSNSGNPSMINLSKLFQEDKIYTFPIKYVTFVGKCMLQFHILKFFIQETIQLFLYSIWLLRNTASNSEHLNVQY